MRKVSLIPPVAQRYALAFFACTETPAKVFSDVQDDLACLEDCCMDSHFLKFLKNPLISVADQEAVLKSLAQKFKFSQITMHFLYLIVRKRRLSLLPQILRAYQKCVAQSKGIVHVDVTTAQPLSPNLKARIEELLGGKEKTCVHISEHVDPSLLGGLIVNLGNRLFDASLRTQLKDMYFSMKGGS